MPEAPTLQVQNRLGLFQEFEPPRMGTIAWALLMETQKKLRALEVVGISVDPPPPPLGVGDPEGPLEAGNREWASAIPEPLVGMSGLRELTTRGLEVGLIFRLAEALPQLAVVDVTTVVRGRDTPSRDRSIEELAGQQDEVCWRFPRLKLVLSFFEVDQV
jgi:hypothetical protein